MSLCWRLVVVFAIQAAALLYMIADRHWTLVNGTPVILETEPVDPRSLFSGDYVALRYKINRLALMELAGEREFRPHEDVYVVLRRGEPYWTPVSAHTTMPAVPADGAVIRGEVVESQARFWNSTPRSQDGLYLGVRYGIEAYFVPEGEGRRIERPAPNEKVSIRIAVDPRGHAAIQALLVNGAERYVEGLF